MAPVVFPNFVRLALVFNFNALASWDCPFICCFWDRWSFYFKGAIIGPNKSCEIPTYVLSQMTTLLKVTNHMHSVG